MSVREHVMLVFGNGWPITDPLRVVDQRWLKKLQTDSDGELQVSYLDTSGLLEERTGSTAGFASWQEEREHVDIIWGTSDMHYANLPIQKALRWFVYGTDIVGSLKVCNQLLAEFPEMQAEFTNLNMKRIVGFAGVGINIQTSRKAVRTLGDLEGLRLSYIGTKYEVFDKLGVTEVNVYQGQEYEAIAKGEVDGTGGYVEFLASFPFADAVRYTTLLNMPFPTHDFYGMNLDRWHSLHPRLQRVFQQSAEWFHEEMTKVQIAVTAHAIETAEAKGHEFIQLPATDQSRFFSLIEEVAARKVADLEAQGLPGKKIFQRARELIEKGGAV
jgi:hypothetical protein